MRRRGILGASMLILSMILVAGLLAQEPMVTTDTSAGSGTMVSSFTPSFDGTSYSSTWSPRTVDEYLIGKNHSVVNTASGYTLNVSGPSGGAWTGKNFNTTIYELFEKRNFMTNSNFSSQTSGYPNYWSNISSDTTNLKALYDTVQRYVNFRARQNDFGTRKDNASWIQTIYLNRSNVQHAWILFNISRNTNPLIPDFCNASVYVNRTKVWTRRWIDISSPGTTRFNVSLSTSLFQNLPRSVPVSLNLSVTGNTRRERIVYFDEVYLYLDCMPFPESIMLKLGPDSVVGDNYGSGKVNLASINLPYTPSFSSNSTIYFKSNSSVNIYRRIQSDSVALKASQGSPNVSWRVNRSSALDYSNQVFGSIGYTRYLFNVSIPHDWTYTNIQFPNGTLRIPAPPPPLVRNYENGSYSWIIMINVTAIGSYRPNPYVVRAESPNYVDSVSRYRFYLGSWLANDTFTIGNSIKINATVQGQASKGSAYVVFYFASNNSVHLNESNYGITPGSGGVVSFVFIWSGGNVSRSDLWTLVLWSNGTSVAANWALVKFDLDPPQLRIDALTGRVYVAPTGGTYAAGSTTLSILAPDAHPKNFTLLIGGAPVKTWNYTTVATYPWNTASQGDGNVSLTLNGCDQLDQKNQTIRYVYVDNSAPYKPTLNYPNDNDVINVYTPTIIWSKASDGSGSGVKSYILQLDTDASFSSPNLRNIPDIGTTNYTVPGAETLSPGKWYWHTCAVDNLGNSGNYSVTRSFSISLPKLELRLPQPSPNIFQSELTGRYYIRGSITLSISVQDSTFKNVSLLMNDIQVQSWNTLSASYGWNTSGTNGLVELALSSYNVYGSNNRTLMLTVYIDNTGPQAPNLSYPNDGDTIDAANPLLTWGIASDGGGSGVNHYTVLLDTTPYFNSTNVRIVDNLSGTNYTVPDNLPLSSGTWYWRVCAVDNLGNVGQYSPTRSFQVPLPGLTVALLVGIGGVVPAIAILSSVVLLRRKRKTEAETFDRKSLIAAYVFSKDGRCMFTHEFKEVKIEPQLFSGFITAISSMMKEILGGTGRALRTIEQPNAKILLELGDITTGALVAKKTSREYRRRLKAFLSRFEHDYAGKISEWDGGDIFADASEIIEEVFAPRAKVTTYPMIIGVEDLLVDKKIGSVAISVAGKTGSGKSTFCLRHAASLLKRGHPVIIVDGTMPPKDLRKGLRTGGVDVDKMEEDGLLILYDAYSEISGLESKEKHKMGSPGELNTINLSLSGNLSKLKNATVIFDSLTSMIEYSDMELAADFIRTIKVKLQQGGHTAFFIIDSNAHDQSTLNYINHVMDGEIEATARRTKKGETERLVSFKRLNGFQIKTGYHQIQ